MHLTPDQDKEVQVAKTGGDRRAVIRFTAEQKNEWYAAMHDELAATQDNVDHVRKIKAAAQQSGFFGDVRRAIAASRRSVDELSAEIGIPPRQFSDFRAGDEELPAAALERLIHILGLRLMQEIPR